MRPLEGRRRGARLAAALPALLAAGPVAAGLAGVALPAAGILPALGGTVPSLQPVRDLLAMPGLGASLALSVGTGLTATLLSLLACLGFLAGAAGTPVFRFMRRALGPLVAVPHAAAAFALAFLIAPSGLVMRLLASGLGLDRPPDLLIVNDPLGVAMTAGLVLKELPFLLLVAFAAWPQADAARRLALARSLGHGRLSAFLVAVWPGLYRQIRLPVLAVAAFSSSVVDVALVLGPTHPAPLAVRLLAWTGDPDLRLRFVAAAGALLQLAATLAVLAVWLALERLGRALRAPFAAGWLRLGWSGALRGPALALPLAGAGALACGLAALALWAVATSWRFPARLPQGLTLRNIEAALAGAAGPLATTALLAAASASLGLALAAAMLEAARRLRPVGAPLLTGAPRLLVMLPLLVPQAAFLFGLQVLALGSGLRPSLPLLLAAHLVFVLPYAVLALAEPFAALDPRFEAVAASLGARPLRRVLALRLPLLAAPLATAFAIGFAVSCGLYLPTLLIGAGRFPTITTEAVALASGGDRRLVAATALLQTALPALVLALAAALPALLHRGRRGMRA